MGAVAIGAGCSESADRGDFMSESIPPGGPPPDTDADGGSGGSDDGTAGTGDTADAPGGDDRDQCRASDECGAPGRCGASFDGSRRAGLTCLGGCIDTMDDAMWCADDAACCDPNAVCQSRGYCVVDG